MGGERELQVAAPPRFWAVCDLALLDVLHLGALPATCAASFAFSVSRLDCNLLQLAIPSVPQDSAISGTVAYLRVSPAARFDSSLAICRSRPWAACW
jgi:hypothetical protein